MSKQSEEKKKPWGIIVVVIPAGLFIGIGAVFGFLMNNIGAGIFLGLGVGFIAMMIGILLQRVNMRKDMFIWLWIGFSMILGIIAYIVWYA